MPISRPARLLRLHLSEADRYRGKPMYEAIVERAQELKIAGATVFRGIEGFGETAEIRGGHLRKGEQPIVLTIVDSAENVERLVAEISAMVDTAMMAASDVEAIRFSKSSRLE